MIKFQYLVEEIHKDHIHTILNLRGQKGWELVSIIPLNRIKSTKILPGTNALEAEVSYQCFFKKENYEPENSKN
jgi:hypothetical protein